MQEKVVIKNENDLSYRHKCENEHYEYKKYDVTTRDEFDQCCVAVYEIAPLKSNYPYHYHTANTEVFYILSGEGILRTEDGERTVHAGDFILCPPTDRSAHKLTNTSADQTLKYIDFDTANNPDIIYYPDSKKTGIITGKGPSSFFPNSSKVDYYTGE